MMMFKTTLLAAVVALLGSTLALPHQQEVKLAIRCVSTLFLRVRDTYVSCFGSDITVMYVTICYIGC
jgi:hypothetical protein